MAAGVAVGEEAGNTMENKYKLPVWQWILLGLLTVVFGVVLINYYSYSQRGTFMLQIPGINPISEEVDPEYVPEPTPMPGT